jgi:hypothetical protein
LPIRGRNLSQLEPSAQVLLKTKAF